MKIDPVWHKTRSACLSLLTVAWRQGYTVAGLPRGIWRKYKAEGAPRRHTRKLGWTRIKLAIADAIGEEDADERVSDLVLSGRIDIVEVAERAADALMSEPVVKAKVAEEKERDLAAERRERDAKDQQRREIDRLVDQVIEQQDKIKAFTQAANRPAAAPVTIHTLKGKRSGEVVLLLSDWHPGDVVEPLTVNGLNRFDRETAEQRVQKLLQGFLWTMEMWRTGYQVDQLAVAILGDMVTGWIHEEQLHSTSMTPPEEVVFCSDLLDGALQSLLDLDMQTRVVCVTGNHGRTTKRVHHSNRGTTSYEWILYHDLARRHGRDAQFHIPNSEFAYLDIDPLKVRFCHGDFFRYSNGVGGITIPMNKAIARQDAAIKADLTCFGHWHQYIGLPHVASNGTLKGYDAFSQHHGFPPEPPSQTAILVDKKRGFPWPKRIWVG